MAVCRAVILLLHALINFLPTRFLALWNAASVVWHVLGTFVLIILLPAVAPMHQSGEYVFTTFNSDTSASGVPSSGYGSCLTPSAGSKAGPSQATGQKLKLWLCF